MLLYLGERVNVIFVEFIIKRKYLISWHGNNIDLDGWTVNSSDDLSLTIFILFLEQAE